MAPRISVVIPVYNGAQYLAEALRSVLAQTFPPLEIIVIDDGSTDISAQVARSFSPPVTVISQPNQGESVARNRGIEAAAGDWVAFLDADDVWKPDKLELQAPLLTAETDCVHTNFFYFGEENGKVDVSSAPPEVRYSIRNVVINNPFRISSIVMRKSLPVRFPEWTQWGEDLIFFLELCQTARIRLVSDYVVGYRVHKRGQSQAPDMLIRRYHSLREYFSVTSRISDTEKEAALRDYITLLVQETKIARYRRCWEQYWCLRRFLEMLPEPVPGEVKEIVKEKIYPRWAYRLKDFVDSHLPLLFARKSARKGHEGS